MFESKLVDFFSRTHAAIVPAIYLPIVSYLIWASHAKGGLSWPITVALVFLGLLVWSFTEYWAHRKLFHWHPKSSWGPRFHFFLHGVHHEWPNDKYRLVMPPAFSLSVFVLTWCLLSLLLGPFARGFMAGFTIGYVFYDLIHYYIHHFAPRTRWLKLLRRHHMVHHFKKEADDKKFGVSSTVWDHVFGTF